MICRHLGSTSPCIAPLGFGCFGLSHAYGQADPQQALDTIHHALDLGCVLLDTADSYGGGENERLVGRAIAARRAQVVLATKGGFTFTQDGTVTGRNGSIPYLQSAVDNSLRRLGTDLIDLYTLHRADPAVPIEESVGALAHMVASGKIRALGLSEVTPAELRRAHKVHPITSVQSEYSLWHREPEQEMLPLCRELGISFVAFSPLGRGVFSGLLKREALATHDFRRTLPRFQPAQLSKTASLVQELETFADAIGLSSSQAALAWILHKGDHLFAIPGTRTRQHLDENMAALQAAWTPQHTATLDRLFAPGLEFGARYPTGSSFAPSAL